jgi:hypothetical protein
LLRPLGRCVGLDVHLDFIEIAICEEGQVFSAGRVPAAPEGIKTLAESLSPTDRVALEVTGSSWEIVRLLEAPCARSSSFARGYWHQRGAGEDRPAGRPDAGEVVVDR